MARREPDAVSSPASVVSIIVTAPAGCTGLDETVASAIGQTHPETEVIIVAGDEEVASSLNAGPFALLASDPGPRGDLRNRGLAAATGPIVIFVDAGERLLPHAAAVGLHELARDSTSALISGRCVVTRPYHSDDEFPQQPLVSADHYEVMLGRNYILTLAAAAFRRSALTELGGFDESLEPLDDWDFYLRLLRTFGGRCHLGVVVESDARDVLREEPARAVPMLWRILDREEEAVETDRHRRAVSVARRSWIDRYGLDAAGLDAAAAAPDVGSLSLGDLRRVIPLDTNFGYGRGTPVDRYYIESFLREHAADIRGRVLEVQEDSYTRGFGGAAVDRADVLSLLPDNPRATMVGDLGRPDDFPESTFDCAIVTQVIHLVLDPRAAARALHRLLKPSGVVLVTVPGISQVEWAESWYWSFTVLSAQATFAEIFGADNIAIKAYGNALAATSFLWGIAVEELDTAELDYVDPYYQVTIAIRALKAGGEVSRS
jgi:SAM-dependent methyltransferase